MNTHSARRLFFVGALAATLAGAPSRASDHADPMSLNVFAVQGAPEANITDLHAFVVDGEGQPVRAFDADGKPVTTIDPFGKDHRLIISLCVRRALRPEQAKTLDLKPYTFRVHLDLAPPVRFVDATASSAGKAGAELAALQQDLSMQALYGGIITHPEDIVETAVLEFDLDLANPGGEPHAILRGTRAWGFLGPTSLVLLKEVEQPRRGDIGVAARVFDQPPREDIGVTADVFDDPFIFPRFFRRNVVGIVTSIPMSKLMPTPPSGPVPILLWATTHKGNQQIDHVGRSLRTQLPRFGHLNDKRPPDQVRAITRVHAQPTILEALLGTIVSPLFAHRHYDSVPDVMIYDLRKPALFPNGRWLEDDVAKTLADAGETLLLELSYAESREFPRATRNDKLFRATINDELLRTEAFPPEPFPYLAERWTKDQIDDNAAPGAIPRAPDAAAIAPPTFDNSVWRRLFWIELGAIAGLTSVLLFTVRSGRLRFALVIVALIAIGLLCRVYAENLTGAGAAEQPAQKLERLLLGLGLIFLLGLGCVFALGRRSVKSPTPQPSFPRDRQGPIADDSRMSRYEEIHMALFDPGVSRPYYKVWGGPGEAALPIYKTTFASVTEGFFAFGGKQFAIERAARRTLKSRGDLRWGSDRNGFRRLVHPMGVCLAGTWKIDASPPNTTYTGYFAPGKEGRVLARYSVGGNHAEGGHHRSLGLVGKVFPLAVGREGDTPRAHFITQEDLGGAFTNSVREAVLTNSPPVTLLNRGSGLFAFIPVTVGLFRADTQPVERQLYEIAELEKPEGVRTRCPRFMRLTIAGQKTDVGDERIDFRNEILGMIYDPGDSQPRRKLVFTIEVSDAGRRTLFQRVVGPQWTRIGSLTFDEAAASYNGDFVVHFHHPVWRRDRNDPGSVQRRGLL